MQAGRGSGEAIILNKALVQKLSHTCQGQPRTCVVAWIRRKDIQREDEKHAALCERPHVLQPHVPGGDCPVPTCHGLPLKTQTDKLSQQMLRSWHHPPTHCIRSFFLLTVHDALAFGRRH